MNTITNLVKHYALATPDKTALVLLDHNGNEAGKLCYAELHQLACHNGLNLAQMAAPGARAVLSFPTSVEFVIAFLACLHARIIPVPVPSVQGQRYRGLVSAIIADCEASLLICPDVKDAGVQAVIAAAPAQSPLIPATVSNDLPADPHHLSQDGLNERALAYLQYTSGSTSAPKGVVVSHQNLSENLRMMTTAFAADATSDVVGWAPLHHDMGLVANLLHPLARGATSILVAPGTFAAKPWLWPEAISHYRASISGGPNHAFELCLRHADTILARNLDLSCWQVAFNSAEPVRNDTITRFSQVFAPAGFRASALYPCYGMAEATLLISGGLATAMPVVKPVSRAALSLGRIAAPSDSGDKMQLVGCGAALPGGMICIVDPASLQQLPDREIGEIWVAGPNISAGYWRRPVKTNPPYRATLANAPGRHFLRTGDLGFLDRGELFFASRQNDTILIDGRPIFPQDIEYTAERCHDGLRANSNALFAVQHNDSTETTLVLVQEVERCQRHSLDSATCISAIRRNVLDILDIALDQVVLIPPGQIPKTSSGKNRRFLTKMKFLQDGFRTLPESPCIFPRIGS